MTSNFAPGTSKFLAYWSSGRPELKVKFEHCKRKQITDSHFLFFKKGNSDNHITGQEINVPLTASNSNSSASGVKDYHTLQISALNNPLYNLKVE